MTDKELLELEAEEFSYSNSKLYRHIYNKGRVKMLDEIMNKAFCDFTNCKDCAMWGQYDEFGNEEVCILEQLKLKEQK